MSRQESQKRGVRSDAQKQARARKGYEPIPPSNPVGGAHGRHEPAGQSDEEQSLEIHNRNQKQKEESN